MAPRRDTDGLLARLAKATGAGTSVLALIAAAMLALAGCGGGDEGSSTPAAQEQTSTAEAGAEAEAGKEGEGGEGREGEGPEGKGSEGKEEEGGEGREGPEGEGEGESAPPQKRELTTASISLESPAFKSGAELKPKYTCEGKNTWPPLKWKGLPKGAEELVLLVLSVRPVVNKLYFDWAVAGLDPSLKQIEEGKLPKGAVVGENSFDKPTYNLCPPKGQKESFIFMLFAIPEALDPSPGFDAKAFRKEVLAQAGDVGLLNATYARK